jgi:hypothetical protein
MSLKYALQDAVVASLRAAVPSTACKSKNIKAALQVDSSMPVILVSVSEDFENDQVFNDLRVMSVELRAMTLIDEDQDKALLEAAVEAADGWMRTARDFGLLDGFRQARKTQILYRGFRDEDNDKDWHQCAAVFLVPFVKTDEAAPSASPDPSASASA